MPYGPAYWSDQIRDPSEAPQSPLFKRLAPAGPWSYASASWQGKPGVAAIWGNVVEPLEKYGAARTCSDGLVYCAPIVMPSQVELGKKSYIPGIEYATSCNTKLTIPLAAGAAAEVNFTTMTLGDPADAFAQAANAIWERRESVLIRDRDLIYLIYLAIAQNYRVTPEMLDDLRWITSTDIDPIYACIMGLDPKALAGAVNASLSTAPALDISP